MIVGLCSFFAVGCTMEKKDVSTSEPAQEQAAPAQAQPAAEQAPAEAPTQ